MIEDLFPIVLALDTLGYLIVNNAWALSGK